MQIIEPLENCHPSVEEWEKPLILYDSITFLKNVFSPTDLLYIGPEVLSRGKHLEHIRQASEWINIFKYMINARADKTIMGKSFQMCCVNPLDGERTKNGMYRADANVIKYKYCIIEHDHIGVKEQIDLLQKLKLPIAAMVFSGGKSIHGLIDVNKFAGKKITTKWEWDEVVKDDLFMDILDEYGFDMTCSNPTRMIRMPGMFRVEKNQWQRLIYMNIKKIALPAYIPQM